MMVITHETGAVAGGQISLCAVHQAELDRPDSERPEWARRVAADYRGIRHGLHEGRCSMCQHTEDD